MINRIKYLLIQLDYLISKTFLYSHSRSIEILRDNFYRVLKNLDRHFTIVRGGSSASVSAANEKYFNKYKALLDNQKANRGDGPKLSTSVTLEEFDKLTLSIIEKNRENIEAYLRRGFLMEEHTLIRNFNFDTSFSAYDIYSNIYHLDSHDGNRMLKVFVLISDVGDNDGPFHYFNLDRVKKSWPKFRERWSFDNFRNPASFNDVQTFTGNAGDFLIIDTSKNVHKAGIPDQYRDILIATLYPKWRDKSKTTRYENIAL